MTLPGGRSVALAALLAAGGCSFGSDRLFEPAACPEPMVTQAAVAANPTNALSVFVKAQVRHADSVVLRFGVTALDSATPAFNANGDSVVGHILGLYPATSYRAQVVAYNRCGTTRGEMLAFATGVLPDDLPAYTAGGLAPSPGYIVFASGNYGLVIDNTGRVVWYHRFPNGPGLNFQPQPNGRYAARPTVSVGQVGSWVEIAPNGTVTRTLGCARGLQPRMHDLIAQPDGSYWLLCDEIRTLDLSAQGKLAQTPVIGTAVQRRSATGDVLFE
jgi:hypothetical protein